MSYQTTKMMVTACIGLGLQMVNIENLGMLEPCRILFLCAQLVCLGICMYIRTRIVAQKENDSVVHVPAVMQFGQEMSPAMTLSVRDYDLTKWKEQLIQVMFGGLICYGIHLWFQFVTPLAIQTFLAPMTVLESPVARVHVFNTAAKGSLKRPWATPNPFGMLQDVKKEAKKKITEAKKADKSVKKKGK